MNLRELLIGKPLRTEAEQKEQVTPLTGIPTLGLDALASSAYGPEAALTILMPLGLLAPNYIGVVAAAIIVVLLFVFFSYRQTIAAYPHGGGSFTVAKENLGTSAGLLAGSALALDYILNVAVAISAGVGALVSAVPVLLPHTLSLCLGILALITIINLRGLRSAGVLFMVPTYLFVSCLGITVVIGVVKTVLAGGSPTPVQELPHIGPAASPVTAWLLLRAFASGCTALTGVEAVSNAVPIFRPPTVKLARRTLAVIVAILTCLTAGIAFLAHSYHLHATAPGEPGYQSVLSQMVAAVTGRGWFYFVTMGAILMVLALSANTSFAGFPRVCRVLAQDEFLPAEFAHRGRRLVYTAGVFLLTLLAALLLIVFGGITDRLIPLFAVGAFLAFTLSQLGMVAHWRRSREPFAKHSLIVNACGAVATGTTLVIIIVSKFVEGAWITVLVIPLLIGLFLRIRRYHDALERETEADGPLDVTPLPPPVIVIPLKRMDRVARKALRMAMTLSGEVLAVQILAEEMEVDNLSGSWERLVGAPARAVGKKPPRLKVIYSAYREFYGPLLAALKHLGSEYPDRTIAVMIPEIVERRWYHFLFRHRSMLLRALLLLHGGPRSVIITIPWYVHGVEAGR